MTDLDAIYRAVIDHPDDDTPRLVYADELEVREASVACPRCLGTGSHALNPYELAQRYGTHRAGMILDAARCGACAGTGSASNGAAARAEFIRVQVELARMAVRPLAEVMLHPAPRTRQAIGPELVAGTLGGSPEGVVAGATVDWEAAGLDKANGYWTGVGVVEGVGTDRHGLTVQIRPIPDTGGRRDRDAARAERLALRRRERELFAANGAEWFGPRACLTPPSEREERAGGEWLIVRRGWPSEVRLTAAALCGGPCGCNATVRHINGGCSRCGAPPEGPPSRTPGLAATLAELPLTRVVLTDREPFAGPSGQCMWAWQAASGDRPHALPPGLMHFMAVVNQVTLVHPTRADALEALNLACLAYIRSFRPVPAV